MFTITHDDLDPRISALGKISLIPWDSETFGFGVADYEPADDLGQSPDGSRLRTALASWAASRQARLVTTTVATNQHRLILALQKNNFSYVDMAYTLRYKDLELLDFSSSQCVLSLAAPEDQTPIAEIAGQAFSHGRYHSDPLFPKELADQRYRDWVRRAFLPHSGQQVIVAKSGDDVQGFAVTQFTGQIGYLHLIGIAPAWGGRRIGLLPAVLAWFSQAGMREVRSKVSAGNIGAVNAYARLGARFSGPQVILHWRL